MKSYFKSSHWTVKSNRIEFLFPVALHIVCIIIATFLHVTFGLIPFTKDNTLVYKGYIVDVKYVPELIYRSDTDVIYYTLDNQLVLFTKDLSLKMPEGEATFVYEPKRNRIVEIYDDDKYYLTMASTNLLYKYFPIIMLIILPWGLHVSVYEYYFKEYPAEKRRLKQKNLKKIRKMELWARECGFSNLDEMKNAYCQSDYKSFKVYKDNKTNEIMILMDDNVIGTGIHSNGTNKK